MGCAMTGPASVHIYGCIGLFRSASGERKLHLALNENNNNNISTSGVEINIPAKYSKLLSVKHGLETECPAQGFLIPSKQNLQHYLNIYTMSTSVYILSRSLYTVILSSDAIKPLQLKKAPIKMRLFIFTDFKMTVIGINDQNPV